MEPRLRYVKVTNKLDKPFVDMFDGVPVTIDAGGSQNILPEQAFHFFGYTEDANKQQMALHTARRQGWNTSDFMAKDEKGRTLLERMFDNFVLEPVVFKLVEDTPALDQPIPAEGSAEEGVESAPPPPRFQPVKPAAKTAAKTAPKRSGKDDDDE